MYKVCWFLHFAETNKFFLRENFTSQKLFRSLQNGTGSFHYIARTAD